MFVNELDSFVKKFHQLWSAGHSAHLDLESHAGRAWVGLRVLLGPAPPGPLHHLLHPHQPQSFYRKPDSPSRQRRRDRRAAARKSKAEEASRKENAEEADPTSTVEKPLRKEDQSDEIIISTAEEATVNVKISDEFCPDENYEEFDDNAPVKEIVLESACEENLDEEAAKDIIEYNLKLLGINIIETKLKKSESGVISCTIIIQPKPKETIKRISLALRDWKVKQCRR